MVVNKATIKENIFKEFYDLLVTNSSFSSITFASYPDKRPTTADDVSYYPICVLEHPKTVSEERLTQTKMRMNLSISFEIMTSSPKTTDEYTSDAMGCIENGSRVLTRAGIKLIKVDDDESEIIEKGTFKIHRQVLKWQFEYIYTRTRLW